MLLPVAAGVVIAAYLVGSIPFGVLFARARGVDLQHQGSGNIGATNAARVLGRGVGALVLLCDAAKGALPVLLVRALVAPRLADPLLGEWLVAGTGGAAFLGHLAPPWLGFRGGKGVATALGVFLALAPLPTAIAVAVFAVAVAATRISSVGSLLATTAFVPSLWALGASLPRVALAAAMWLLIVVKHRGNIERLLRRAESRV